MKRIDAAAKWLNDFAEDGLAPLKDWIDRVGADRVIGVLVAALFICGVMALIEGCS
jgi:hypothetical protein